MKKETKKNLISLTCALALVAVGGGVAFTVDHAKAEEINLIPENQMVLEEPEFRLKKAEEDENRNGLRFVVKAPNATELPEGTTETGTLVIPTDLLSGELSVNTADAHKFVTTEAWNIYEDDGAYTYAYFWNMSESSYNVEMTYRAYIVMGGETYYTKTATTSLAEVALDFINNSTDDGEKAVADQFLLNYDVTFNVGDSSTTVNAQQVKYGSKLTGVVTPELEGHTFNGWLLNGEAFDVENTAIKGDIELVADWELNTYAVTFKDVDGTLLDEQTVNHGEQAEDVATPALKEGYASFLGWFDENGNEFDFDTAITVDTVVKAKAQTANCLDFTSMTAGYKPAFVTAISTKNNAVKDYEIVEGEGLKISEVWADDLKSINFAEAISLKTGDTIIIDVTVQAAGEVCSNPGWGLRFYSVNDFTTMANPAPAEQVLAGWDDNNTTEAVLAGHRETYTYTVTNDLSLKSFELRTYSRTESYNITFHSVHIHQHASTVDPTDYKNINFAELGGKTSNMSVVTTGGVQKSYYCPLEQAVVCKTYSNTSGPARIGALFTFPTEGDDVITVVAGMKISLVVKVELTNVKSALTGDIKGGFYFNNGQWGANDNVVTVKMDGTSTGYQTVSFTIAAGNAQIGSTLTEFNWKPWHTGNNVHTIYVKSVTIELPQA